MSQASKKYNRAEVQSAFKKLAERNADAASGVLASWGYGKFDEVPEAQLGGIAFDLVACGCAQVGVNANGSMRCSIATLDEHNPNFATASAKIEAMARKFYDAKNPAPGGDPVIDPAEIYAHYNNPAKATARTDEA